MPVEESLAEPDIKEGRQAGDLEVILVHSVLPKRIPSLDT